MLYICSYYDISLSKYLILSNVNGAKTGFFMSPEILRVGFFMGWPKRMGFLMVVFFMVVFYDPHTNSIVWTIEYLLLSNFVK